MTLHPCRHKHPFPRFSLHEQLFIGQPRELVLMPACLLAPSGIVGPRQTGLRPLAHEPGRSRTGCPVVDARKRLRTR